MVVGLSTAAIDGCAIGCKPLKFKPFEHEQTARPATTSHVCQTGSERRTILASGSIAGDHVGDEAGQREGGLMHVRGPVAGGKRPRGPIALGDGFSRRLA